MKQPILHVLRFTKLSFASSAASPKPAASISIERWLDAIEDVASIALAIGTISR